jgi:hypothetical protein
MALAWIDTQHASMQAKAMIAFMRYPGKRKRSFITR